MPRVLNWIVTHMFGEWLYCFEVWQRRECVSAMMILQCQDLALVLHCFIGVEIYRNNLTHGGYVIGGGTGELPPKEMKFRYLGFVTC